MKLHLPKSLRSALLATFISAVAFSYSASAAWEQASATDGGKYDCYQYDAGSISAQPLTLVTGETGSVDVGEIGPNGVWLRAKDSQLWASNPVEAHISSFTIHANAVLKISGQWSNSAAGFRNLVIDELIYSNGGQLEIGTTYNGEGYPVQNVLIKDVSGSLGAVTINKNNVLTLASAELAGSITNNGVLNITGTLTGSGEIKGEGVVQIDTFAGGSFNGMAYTYADGSAATSDACFVKGSQTFQVLGEGLSYAGDVYINGSQTATTIGENGYVTVDFGDSNVFYVNDVWSYNAAQSAGASYFNIMKGSELVLDSAEQNPNAAILKEGSGTIRIATGVQVSNASTNFAGDLVIGTGGKTRQTLTVGGGWGVNGNITTNTANVFSFNSIILDNGEIVHNAIAGTIKNLTVTANGGRFAVYDQNTSTPITLTGTTILNGDLDVVTGWKQRLNIDMVKGAGDLNILAASNAGSGDSVSVSIKNFDNYSGHITVNHKAGSKETVLTLGNNETFGKNKYDKLSVTLNDGVKLVIDGANANSDDGASDGQYFGKLELGNGTLVNITDGSYYFCNGIYVKDGASATIENRWDKTQTVKGLYGASTAQVTLKRLNESGYATWNSGFNTFVLTEKGNFSGTIHLRNEEDVVGYNHGLTVKSTAGDALEKAVVEFGGDSDHGSVLLFSDTVSSTNGAKLDGKVAGLTGTKGRVYAKNLTINVAESATHTYNGELYVESLTKSGSGTQVFTRDWGAGVSIDGGVLEYEVNDTRTHSGSISGSATFRKSGSGVLTLSGAVGSAEGDLGKLEVAAGKVALDTDAYISQTSGNGTLEILADKTTTVSGKYSVLDTVVGSNAKLQFASSNDLIDYGKANLKITLNGGTWELGTGRQSLGDKFELVLNNGKVIGSNISDSAGDDLGALDLIGGTTGKIVSSGTSSITGGVRLRSDMHINVQDGILTIDSILNGNGAGKGIIKQGGGTLVLTLTNSYQEGLYTGNTIMENGAIKYDIEGTHSYAGTITGSGDIIKAGTGSITIAAVDSLDGDITVSGGNMTITNLTLANTMEVTEDGGSLSVTNIALADNIALEQYGDAVTSYYSTDGTKAGQSANGFLTHDGTYYLFKGKEWAGSIGDYTIDTTTSAGNTLITLTHASSVYYVNEGVVNFAGDNATAGTADASAFVVKSGATLRVDGITSTMNMRTLLESVSGSGTLLINSSGLDTGNGTNHHLTTSFAGTLELAAGVTFTMGNGANGQYSQESEINTDTLTGLVLNDGSTLQYNANGKTNIANVHVVDGAEATIYFKDSKEQDSVQLTDKTLLDGDLILSTIYDGGINIHHLVGDGSLKGGSGSGNFNTVISSLTFTDGEDVSTFSGSLEFTGNSNHVIVSTGTGADVELNKLSADGVASFAFNVQTDTSVEQLNVSGGTVNLSEGVTLLLGDGTTETEHNIGTLNASEGSIIHLQDKATLNRVASVTGSTVTLTGSGVYDLGNTSAINVSGLTDAQNWIGTVKMTKAHIGAFNPASYGNANSAVELCGVTAWMAEASQMASLLKLTKDGDKNGLTITDGSNWTHTFSGKVTGEGDFTISGTGNGTPTFVFTGDLSEWKGAFREENASVDKTVTLNLTGGGTLFADAAAGVYMNQSVDGKFAVIVGHDSKDTTMRGTVSNAGSAGELNLTVQGNTTFEADVTATQVTVNSGKTAKLGSVATISGQGGNAVLTEVHMNNTGISGTAADGSSSVKNALLALKSGASFTVKDVDLRNVTLSAETKDTLVQLQNVTGAATLQTGTYAMDAVQVPAATRAATTTINYQLAGSVELTLANNETSVIISTDPWADCGVEPNVYDMSFFMNLTLGADFTVESLTGEDWRELVSFGGGLGELLDLQGATYLSPADEVAAITGNPYVFYDYEVTDGIGSLVVTVHGVTVPEPTTATLSLLALAALAARRRRK